MASPVQPPGRIDEPQAAQQYADVLTRVAADRRPVIVRRGGEDLAAVVPLEYLELLQDLFARQHAEQMTAQVNWDRLVQAFPPLQTWFAGEELRPF